MNNAELIEQMADALRQSNAAMALARARWPECPSPAQQPAANAIREAMARNRLLLESLTKAQP